MPPLKPAARNAGNRIFRRHADPQVHVLAPWRFSCGLCVTAGNRATHGDALAALELHYLRDHYTPPRPR